MLGDESDDEWLIEVSPSKAKQVTKEDVQAYLNSVTLSAGAATLSKRIAKSQQKRARRRLSSGTSLSSIREHKSKSPIRGHGPGPSQSDSSFSSDSREISSASISDSSSLNIPNENVIGTSTPEITRESDLAFSMAQMAFSSPLPAQILEEFEVSPPPDVKKQSTPVSFCEPPRPCSVLSPVEVAFDEDEEEFEDAPDQFSPEALERISMTASFSAIEELFSRNEECDEIDGQSCIRPLMSQSLMKVEEEEYVSKNVNGLELTPRNGRSSSVSPRSVQSSEISPSPLSRNNANLTPGSQNNFIRNGHERRSLQTTSSTNRSHSRPTVAFAPLTTTPLSSRTGRQPRSKNVKTSFTTPSPRNGDAYHTAHASPQTNNNSIHSSDGSQYNSSSNNTSTRSSSRLHYAQIDLQTLEDISRQQEEALRQDVIRRQMQQQQRKHSWQEDVPSATSSVGSLASSKSVDIGALNKATVVPSPPQSTHTSGSGSHSRIPAPSRLPRPTTAARPVRITAASSSGSVAKSAASDDDCF